MAKPTEHDGVRPSRILVELWREKVKYARRRYTEKVGVSNALATESRQLLPRADPVVELAFRRTLRLEAEALQRYMQALRTYRDLVVHGVPPSE